jgi:glycosyltransferase involved in cell wall biosynthesis
MNTDRIHDLRDEKEVREHYDLPYDFKVVGMVATIDWRKNFRMFIRAALALLEVRRDVVFFIVGDGEDRKEIEDMVPENFKKSNFVFTGRINNVEEVINIFNVAVLASYGEGTSNSILEYMMLKKPVVATDVYGINEVVKHGTNGYLVPQDDHMAMKDKINELLNNSVLSQKMGENGYQFVINECSIEKMVSLHEKLFGEVIKKRMPNNG